MATQTPTVDAASISVAPWLFWTLIALIVLLFVLLLIRDSAFRGFFKKLFTWVGKRIEVAKIKSRINRNVQRRNGLLHILGQKVWEGGVRLPDGEADLARIDALDKDDKSLRREIERLNKQMEEKRREMDDLDRSEDEKVDAIEEKRKPIVAEFKTSENTVKNLEKEIKNLEKEKQRFFKKTGQIEDELEELAVDGERTPQEKENMTRPLQLQIDELAKQSTQADRQLEELQTNLSHQVDIHKGLETQVDRFDADLEKLKQEQKKRQKESEKSLDTMDKDKRARVIKRVGLEKELTLLFEKLGKEAYKLRLEEEELALIIIQIDDIENAIQELERKLN